MHDCRFCGASLRVVFADLGTSPPSNAFLRADQLDQAEAHFPLCAYVCESCWLVQLPAFQRPEEIFADYAYFSSYSSTWLAHAERYAAMAKARFGLGPQSLVVEVASNDGYLLRNFQAAGIPVLGIEPAANVAAAANAAGIPTRAVFFGAVTAAGLAAEGQRADLLVGNNVLAHVPDLNDFVAGLAIALKVDGVLTMEFPHLLRLIADNQFDTIYHEHFSYFSLATVRRVFASHGLRIFDVEELDTHGGSLRIFACLEAAPHASIAAVPALVERERAAGLERRDTYVEFNDSVRRTKRALLAFLIEAKAAGKSVVGYGAPAKGNTLLNFCGVRTDFIDFTVDISPHKQGLFLPGSRIPILAPAAIAEARPDYVLILPWNLKDEIVAQMGHIRDWGGRFVVPVPRLEVF
ncbi:class I SAM-dependent methyltransferase [soil metagenome]